MIVRVERVAWWNRKWERLVRRDVMIYHDDYGSQAATSPHGSCREHRRQVARHDEAAF